MQVYAAAVHHFSLVEVDGFTSTSYSNSSSDDVGAIVSIG